MTANVDSYMFIALPHNFYNDETRAKIEIKAGKVLFIEVNYEIHKANHDEKCHFYKNIGSDTYDECKKVGKRLIDKFNCTIPFLDSKEFPICKRDEVLGEAIVFYKEAIYSEIESCPLPCVHMYANFGFPSFDNNKDNTTARVKFYFKTVVKITEDYISYDLLRF